MRTFRMVVPVIVTVCMLLLTGMHDAYAQKKKTTTKPPAATEQTPLPSSQSTPKMGNSLKDLLMKFKGELTTLGVLKQVEGDHFVVEEEGTLVIYPMSTIKSIKVMNPPESSGEEEEEQEPAPKLDIRLQ